MINEMITVQLKALADPTRLRIVDFLSHRCCHRAAVRENGDVESATAGEVCCHITGGESVTSTISHHLHELERAGLISIAKRGKTALCSLNPEPLEALSMFFDEVARRNTKNDCC